MQECGLRQAVIRSQFLPRPRLEFGRTGLPRVEFLLAGHNVRQEMEIPDAARRNRALERYLVMAEQRFTEHASIDQIEILLACDPFVCRDLLQHPGGRSRFGLQFQERAGEQPGARVRQILEAVTCGLLGYLIEKKASADGSRSS
jgi:hypothetical protein